MKLTTTTFVSLDGVMQGIDGEDEVRRGGLERGGWAKPLFDEETATVLNQIYERADALLFDRRTYEIFAGSSNLSAGGEMANGDNLLEFRDAALATVYAVEAISLIDHYRFRAAMQGATSAEPLRLKGRGERWSRPFFESGSRKYRDRELFARERCAPSSIRQAQRASA
jgi:hypothetical protein